MTLNPSSLYKKLFRDWPDAGVVIFTVLIMSFVVTAASSELDRVGATFVQLKMSVVNTDRRTENIYLGKYLRTLSYYCVQCGYSEFIFLFLRTIPGPVLQLLA